MDAKKPYISPFVLIIFLTAIDRESGLEQHQTFSASLKGVSGQIRASGTAKFKANITKERISPVITNMIYTLNVTGLNPKEIIHAAQLH